AILSYKNFTLAAAIFAVPPRSVFQSIDKASQQSLHFLPMKNIISGNYVLRPNGALLCIFYEGSFQNGVTMR
ncbi:hypothetical protein HMPREF1986_00396, partial [Oribacterium sp. oral taxon 078 str. F0263]|uniref:hypothetical protein n=1 Tax=Oribacterium sp. oral taxon 078 TaxID=652706 RepID=UPI0003AE1844